MLAFLLSKTGLTVIAVALVFGIIGVQSLRLANAKHDLVGARAAQAAAEAKERLSEGNRLAEYQKARTAAGEASTACNARVAAALKSGAVIRTIVRRPVVVDARGCPVRALVSAADLRAAVQP